MAELTVNTTTAKGLEAAIIIASKAINKMQSKIDGIFYGKYSLSKDDAETASFIQKIQDRGIVYVLDTISSIDLCNILNYAIDQIPGGKKFNPDDPNKPTDPVGRAKWNLQYKAFKIQAFIDDYYTSYGDATNKDSKLGLQSVIKEIQAAFGEILNPEAQADFNDPVLLEAFPEISVFSNFIENSLGVFNQYTDIRTVPNKDLQKIIQYIDKIRGICIAIQGLNDASAILNFASTFLNGKIQEEIAKLNKLIGPNPAKLIPKLRGIIDTCKSIIQIAKVIMRYVNFGRVIIRLCILLIKIFKRIVQFLMFLGVPNIYTTLGITNTQSSGTKKIETTGIDNFVKRLNQINAFLGLIVNFVQFLIGAIQVIIDKITILILNLENCNAVDPQIVKDLQGVRAELISERDNLKKFVEDYEARKKNRNSAFGDYNIAIIVEEVTDTAFKIKRRYGVAIDKNGNVALQSTPTYATLDIIIINEVKQLLMSKGLVKNGYSNMNSQDLNTIEESLNFLEDDNISIDDLSMTNLDDGLDSPDNENEDSGLGLNAFVNKLDGGKKLRSRMRKTMAQQSRSLASDLKSNDGGSGYTNKIVAQKNSEANKADIANLKDQIKDWQKEMAVAAALGPVTAAVIIKDRSAKIKDAENKIKQLERRY
jgi:hypothetical protein